MKTLICGRGIVSIHTFIAIDETRLQFNSQLIPSNDDKSYAYISEDSFQSDAILEN